MIRRVGPAAAVLLLTGTACGAMLPTAALSDAHQHDLIALPRPETVPTSTTASVVTEAVAPTAPRVTDASPTASVPASGAVGATPDPIDTAATPATDPATATSSSTAPASTVPDTTAPPSTAPPSTAPVRSGEIVSPVTSVGDPIGISIPSIGVQSLITPTGVLDDGTVDVPADASIAGWFEPGPRPGERGPAVVMGHVDSRSQGPGVFYRLREIPVGAVVTIETTDGVERFVVRSVEQYPKDEFPTERVYGSVRESELRLITCGGSFDASVRSYRDNIVAFLVPEGRA